MPTGPKVPAVKVLHPGGGRMSRKTRTEGTGSPDAKKTSGGKKKPGQQKGKQNSSQMPSGKTLAEHQSPKKPD